MLTTHTEFVRPGDTLQFVDLNGERLLVSARERSPGYRLFTYALAAILGAVISMTMGGLLHGINTLLGG